MSAQQTRRVALEIITRDVDHCSSNCGFIRDISMQTASCVLYPHQPLVWDERRKVHGYKRAEECQTAEIREDPA